MKEETIEEAAKTHLNSNAIPNDYQSFIKGANCQAEQMYSEEDMKQFGLYLGDNLKKLKGKTIDEIFKQFKKNR